MFSYKLLMVSNKKKKINIRYIIYSTIFFIIILEQFKVYRNAFTKYDRVK